MRFSDNEVNLRFLNLKSLQSPKKLYFKSYLEKCDVEWKVERQQLDKAGLNDYILDTIVGFAPYVSLEFNVFSEYREEAIDNYDKLLELIDYIRPVFTATNEAGPKAQSYKDLQFSLDTFLNQEPVLFFRFKGLPKILKVAHTRVVDVDGGKKPLPLPDVTVDDLPMGITQFSYLINKEMGYLQVPYDGTLEERKLLFASGKMRLIPIAYKVSISFRIIASPANFATINYGNIDKKLHLPGDTSYIDTTGDLEALRNFARKPSAKEKKARDAAAAAGAPAAPVGASPPSAPASKSSKLGWEQIQYFSITGILPSSTQITFAEIIAKLKGILINIAFREGTNEQQAYESLKSKKPSKGFDKFNNVNEIETTISQVEKFYNSISDEQLNSYGKPISNLDELRDYANDRSRSVSTATDIYYLKLIFEAVLSEP